MRKYMKELCGDTVPWKVIRCVASDFPEGTALFEVNVGNDMYKAVFAVVSPLNHNGLFAVKNMSDGTIASMGLTMEGALCNAISRGLNARND